MFMVSPIWLCPSVFITVRGDTPAARRNDAHNDEGRMRSATPTIDPPTAFTDHGACDDDGGSRCLLWTPGLARCYFCGSVAYESWTRDGRQPQ